MPPFSEDNNPFYTVSKIKQQGLPDAAPLLPLVSLEDFFIGNDDISSIGCNLINSPGPQAFFQTFQAICSKPTVQDVLVEIMEVEEQETDMWPFSERVYVLADASPAEVETWVASLEPDAIEEGYEHGISANAPVLEPNVKVFSIWWD